MYVPSAFAETRIDVLHDFIRRHDFATIVTCNARGQTASHVPIILLPQRGRLGALQFHLARPNEQCEELAAGGAALAIFHGPHGYISPTWYTTTQAVPTWNYVVVHASGTARVLNDAELRDHLDALVGGYERNDGWSTAALKPDLFEKLRSGVTGFELEISQLQGKWKLGQNRSVADRQGAIEALRRSATHEASELADLMAASLDQRDAK